MPARPFGPPHQDPKRANGKKWLFLSSGVFVVTMTTGATPQVAPPWQQFDLSGWEITLPVNADGARGGHDAVTVHPINSSTMAGVRGSSTYFFTSPNGGMTFYAPVDGARMPGAATYPRSELLETGYSTSHSTTGWPLRVGGELDATLAVNQVPAVEAGKVAYIIIGQIHGHGNELCKLTYAPGGVPIKGTGTRYNIAFDYVSPEVPDTYFGVVPMSAAIPVGQRFSYRIRVQDSRLVVSVTANDQTYTTDPGPLDSSWQTAGGGVYVFKAGVYDGADSSGEKTQGTGAGQVTFYNLAVQH
jgi:poly(beta-D-mannuronate) lyase